MPVLALTLSAKGGSIMTPRTVKPQIITPEFIDPTEYDELQGSPVESYGDNGPTVTRELLTPWENRHNLATKLKGRSRWDGQNWFQIMPHHWPETPQAVVDTINIQPFDNRVKSKAGDTRFAAYKVAQLTVSYKTPSTQSPQPSTDQNGDEIFISEDIEPHGEFITLPYNKFFWKDKSPIAETESPSRIIRTFTWVYTRHKMTQIPAFMLDYVGTVNETQCTSRTLGFTFDAETLLFDEPRLSRDITSEGVQAWKVTMKMIYRPYTWQKFWRAGKNFPEYLYTRQLAPGAEPPSPTDEDPDRYYDDVIFKPYETNEFRNITG